MEVMGLFGLNSCWLGIQEGRSWSLNMLELEELIGWSILNIALIFDTWVTDDRVDPEY
jgi:hypothetical protein